MSILSLKSIVRLQRPTWVSKHRATRIPAGRRGALGWKIDKTPTTLSNNSRPSLGAAVGSVPSSVPAAWNPHSPARWAGRSAAHESRRRKPESISLTGPEVELRSEGPIIRNIAGVDAEWDRRRRLVDWEDVHSDSICEATSPWQYQDGRLAHTFCSAKRPYTWTQCPAIPNHRPYGEIVRWRWEIWTWPLVI